MSKDSDTRDYFSHMAKHMIPFSSTQDGEQELIDLAFGKKKADNRKDWLRQFRVRLLFPPTLVMPLPFDLLITCAAQHLPQP